MVQTSTIVAATVGTVATGLIAYAVYFDHRRRTDPDFRKQLKRESRKIARAAKEEAEASSSRLRDRLKAAVEEAKAEGFPADVEEKEAYFMNEIAKAEQLSQEGTDNVEAALGFYKALKVYPVPADLMNIYDKTVQKPVHDLLAEMIAFDSSLHVAPFGGSSGSDNGTGGVSLD